MQKIKKKGYNDKKMMATFFFQNIPWKPKKVSYRLKKRPW